MAISHPKGEVLALIVSSDGPHAAYTAMRNHSNHADTMCYAMVALENLCADGQLCVHVRVSVWCVPPPPNCLTALPTEQTRLLAIEKYRPIVLRAAGHFPFDGDVQIAAMRLLERLIFTGR